MIKCETIVVIGRGSALEHEICNLGRSLGHRMICISDEGRPEGDEPWVAGIEWVQQRDIRTVDGLELEEVLTGCYSVVLCDHVGRKSFQDDPQIRAQNMQGLVLQIADAAENAEASKFVWVRTTEYIKSSEAGSESGDDDASNSDLHYYKDAEDDLLSRSFRATIFRPTVIFGQGVAMQVGDGDFIKALPLECVAMAALRASLEPDTTGIMERDAIEFYGDAMMIQ